MAHSSSIFIDSGNARYNAGRFPISICPAFEYLAFFSGDAVTGKKNNFIGLM